MLSLGRLCLQWAPSPQKRHPAFPMPKRLASRSELTVPRVLKSKRFSEGSFEPKALVFLKVEEVLTRKSKKTKHMSSYGFLIFFLGFFGL